jgi:hypothetical protein
MAFYAITAVKLLIAALLIAWGCASLNSVSRPGKDRSWLPKRLCFEGAEVDEFSSHFPDSPQKSGPFEQLDSSEHDFVLPGTTRIELVSPGLLAPVILVLAGLVISTLEFPSLLPKVTAQEPARLVNPFARDCDPAAPIDKSSGWISRVSSRRLRR